MAHRLMGPLRRAAVEVILLPLSSSFKTLTSIQRQIGRPAVDLLLQQRCRNYISEMRKSAFEQNILRLLRNEIQYEIDRSPPAQSSPRVDSFTVDELPGEQWIRLTKKFGEKEEIKVEVTMFDGSLPAQKTGIVPTEDDRLLHITMIVDVIKGDGCDVLEFVCSTWPDSIEIRQVSVRGRDQKTKQPYMGPGFKELDDELQDSLYEFLEARGINDELAAYLHKYMKNKDRTEYVRWMSTVKSFLERKNKTRVSRVAVE